MDLGARGARYWQQASGRTTVQSPLLVIEPDEVIQVPTPRAGDEASSRAPGRACADPLSVRGVRSQRADSPTAGPSATRLLGAVRGTGGSGCGEPGERAGDEADRPPSESALDREDGPAVHSDAEALEVAEEVSGTETPVAAPYWPHGVDQGTVSPDKRFRALIVLQLRNKAELEDHIAAMYSPSSSRFRQYLTFSELTERYAPTLTTVNAVKSWLSDQGFEVSRTARNRLVLSYTGTVRQFNAAFGTRLHLIKRSAGTWRAASYAPTTSLDVPDALIGKIRRLLMPDPEAATGTLSRDTAPVVTSKPSSVGAHLTPQQIARAYGMSSLHVNGYRGAGMTLGIIGATLFKVSDLQSMWQAFGIRRADPIVVQTMEPIITRDLEATLDVELAGAIAPGAEIVYYGGPDNSDTSLLYTFNEAVGAARAQVLSDSLAHSEYTTP